MCTHIDTNNRHKYYIIVHIYSVNSTLGDTNTTSLYIIIVLTVHLETQILHHCTYRALRSIGVLVCVFSSLGASSWLFVALEGRREEGRREEGKGGGRGGGRIGSASLITGSIYQHKPTHLLFREGEEGGESVALA